MNPRGNRVNQFVDGSTVRDLEIVLVVEHSESIDPVLLDEKAQK